jgi:serine/threonine-protein kinase HipA
LRSGRRGREFKSPPPDQKVRVSISAHRDEAHRCVVINTIRAGERVHQEDLCQATRREPTAKYERTGGPTLRDVAGLLDAHAADPLRELDRLVAHVTFAILVGNADAHGKNVALLHRGGHVELAPLYDQVPTDLWPNLRRDAAMSIGARVATIDEIRTEDIVAEARLWAHDAGRARDLVTATAEQALAVADVTGHEGVRDLVRSNAGRLLGR